MVTGVTRAQIALAWLRSTPAVVAALVGADTTQQIDDAVSSLEFDLTDKDIRALEAHYTPRHDFQDISDERQLQAIRDQMPQMNPAR